ncbi:MAG: hypothetical protein IJW27_02440, partial [Clostridia bacterium]|nr:hypothetical protein [Clostridia bacterium]
EKLVKNEIAEENYIIHSEFPPKFKEFYLIVREYHLSFALSIGYIKVGDDAKCIKIKRFYLLQEEVPSAPIREKNF